MSLLNVGSYLLLFAMLAHPQAPWARVLSFLPPFAPALMSARIALGVVSPWEVLAAALVMLASIYGVSKLVGRIYAELRSGAPAPRDLAEAGGVTAAATTGSRRRPAPPSRPWPGARRALPPCSGG